MNLLLDSALKATLILFAAWTASLALRRASADLRHVIWLAAILAVAMLPAALAIPQSAIPNAVQIIVPTAALGTQAARKLPWLSMMPLILWTTGASLLLLRLIVGILSAARITRSARTLDGILYSDRAATPMTWGFLHPVVILPSYAAEWTAAQRDLVVRHERAHIERHDWLWQMLASLLTAVFWFHPLMWLANFQLRREAEGAADDLVLSTGAAPSEYAGRLLDVARHLRGLAAPAAVVPMVRSPELETRVRSILDPSRRRVTAGILMRCAIALAAAALIVPIAVTRQSVHAQGKVYKVGDGVSQPSIIYKVEPVYTPEAKEEKIQGAVKLEAEITPLGIADNIRVVKGIDPGLDANAVTAVSNWRFKPGMKDGEAVTVAVTIEVNFRLL
jgi:TonB family protein